MQWLLAQLEEAMKSRQAKHVAQKAKREANKKTQEKTERQRVAEEEEDNGVPPTTPGQDHGIQTQRDHCQR